MAKRKKFIWWKWLLIFPATLIIVIAMLPFTFAEMLINWCEDRLSPVLYKAQIWVFRHTTNKWFKWAKKGPAQ